jgi:DNA-binding MarR family transcriptional regulator
MAISASELGPTRPVSETEVLAATARAELLRIGRRKGPYISDIANHLGWRYSGAATVRLRPHLTRLVAAGDLASVEPPRYKRRGQIWTTTAEGRGRLASAEPVDLPESPQHRRWRQDRDVAAWALDGVRPRAAAVMDEAYQLLADQEGQRPLTDSDVYRLIRRFEARFKALALAIRMCERWPEPSDAAADDAPDHVSALLPDNAKRRRD